MSIREADTADIGKIRIVRNTVKEIQRVKRWNKTENLRMIIKPYLFLTLFLIPVICCSQIKENKTVKIDTTEVVQIGGIKQFISIKGNKWENPLLLILHGGPGKSLIPFAPGFTDKLLNDFTVVNWDQRNTGETLSLNQSKAHVAVDLLKSDALEIVQYLTSRYNQKKIYLLSHSWGSVMGFELASKHPELFLGYIAVSPVVDANESASLFVKDLKIWAAKTNNQAASQELENIKLPFQNQDDFFYAQKWLFIHNGVPGIEKDEFKTAYYNWMNDWFPIWKENAKTNLPASYPKIDCPIYFFIGVADNQSYYTLAEKYYKELKAKHKNLYWFKKSGHTIFNTEADKLQYELIKIKSEQK